jgi:hypothetical protein
MRADKAHRIQGLVAGALVLALGEGDGARADGRATSYPKRAAIEQYLMADRASEIALARSAAPPAISADATILVLTPHGYETAVKGKNGFTCSVERKWQSPFDDPEFWNPKVRSPICLNPPAARSIGPVQLKRTELALTGLSKSDIMAQMKEAFARNDFGPLEPGAMSYMMSRQQYLDDRDPHFHPHLMFYAPNSIRGADWGANLPGSPVMLGSERLPDGTLEPFIIFVVPTTHWSDGTVDSQHHRP